MAKWVNFFSVLFVFHIKGEHESGNRHEWDMVLVKFTFSSFQHIGIDVKFEGVERFPKWNREIRIIGHEIPKIQKRKEMNKLRAKLMGMRCLESYIQSRYQGLCELDEDRIRVIVPLYNKHDLTVNAPFLYYIPKWWERIQEMVDAFYEYFMKRICEGNIDLELFRRELTCYSNNQWYEEFYTRFYCEDFEALSKKKGWRKWCPITVEIA